MPNGRIYTIFAMDEGDLQSGGAGEPENAWTGTFETLALPRRPDPLTCSESRTVPSLGGPRGPGLRVGETVAAHNGITSKRFGSTIRFDYSPHTTVSE